MSGKYYAVHEGMVKGVFQDWNLVKGFVIGYSGAKYKSFKTYEEAEYFHLNGKIKSTFSKVKTVPYASKHLLEINSSNTQQAEKYLEIYTDGSCQKKKGGYGVVVVLDNDKYRGLKGPVPYTPCTNQIAELYAIYIALKEYPRNNIIIYSDSMYCINIFTKWFQGWINSGWKKSNGGKIENSELIKEINMILDNSHRTVKFKHVYAHTGHPLNDMADTLAKEGVHEY